MLKTMLVATAVGGCLAAGIAAPAHAEKITIHDGRDTDAKEEMMRVSVKHDKRVTVVIKYSSNYFVEDGEVPFSIDFNTKPRNPGPEFHFFSHFGAVYTTNGWNAGDGHEVKCSIRGGANTDNHTWRLSFAHRCFKGDKGPIGVNVAASTTEDPSAPGSVDYAPARHTFSELVARN